MRVEHGTGGEGGGSLNMNCGGVTGIDVASGRIGVSSVVVFASESDFRPTARCHSCGRGDSS